MSETTSNNQAATLNSQSDTTKIDGSVSISLKSYNKIFTLTNVSTKEGSSHFEIFATNEDSSYGLTLKVHNDFKEGENPLNIIYDMQFWARQWNGWFDVYSLARDAEGGISFMLNADGSIRQIDFQLYLKLGVYGNLDLTTGQINLSSK
jgi:hypothetical protein